MSFRRTRGIVSDLDSSDAKKEADVIMTAAAVGFAASYIKNDHPIQFDMDPLDVPDEGKTKTFNGAVNKIDKAVADYLHKKGLAPKNKVHAGTSPGYTKGAVIVGVYKLAGQTAPPSISAPVLTDKGRVLWEKIRTISSDVPQYTGRGAYTGFVDNKNTTGNTDPVGPRSTARFQAPAPGLLEPDPHPRWLPPMNSPLWAPRKRKDAGTYVPWGLIMGDSAAKDPDQPNATSAGNLADQSTIEMRDKYGMVFNGEPTTDDIAAYTHGMIQAIYKAYGLGPSCTPYEIAVGDKTKKMASCLTCTLFMSATGYPPTSIHLGRGESWAPLYQPYNPNGPTDEHELAVIRDLNNAWYDKCTEFLTTGLEILDNDHIAADHTASRDAVANYLKTNAEDKTVAGVLILDAVTVHDGETERINRTLK
jgi:hypothetical protein